MELFSEIYGCYFTVIAHILEQAQNGLTKTEIEKLVSEQGFYESTFHLLPSLFSGEWNLLKEKDNRYYSKINTNTKRPLTILEKSWLKALLNDPRIQLFLDEETLNIMHQELKNIDPLFLQNDFHVYDQHSDGDSFDDAYYISQFKIILQAIKEHKLLTIKYTSSQMEGRERIYYPYKLCYSARDNKIRLLCAAFNTQKNIFEKSTLNLARITSVQITENYCNPPINLSSLFGASVCTEPIFIEISKERNALERCMLQFASFERQTEYDKEHDVYICRIWYDTADETELLIRILSFGPVIKVLGPKPFLDQIKKRIAMQLKLNQ